MHCLSRLLIKAMLINTCADNEKNRVTRNRERGKEREREEGIVGDWR